LGWSNLIYRDLGATFAGHSPAERSLVSDWSFSNCDDLTRTVVPFWRQVARLCKLSINQLLNSVGS
jgi:hypothetical protein